MHKFESRTLSEKYREKDFIILSPTYGYIMLIEAKKTLTPVSFKSVIGQLNDNKEKLIQYLQSDLLMDHWNIREDWVVIPMIYCEAIAPGFKLCDTCELHIIKGNIIR